MLNVLVIIPETLADLADL